MAVDLEKILVQRKFVIDSQTKTPNIFYQKNNAR